MVADTVPSRVELATSLGALGGAVPDGVEEVVHRISEGAGADAVVIAAASNDGRTLELAARCARDRAVISVVGNVKLQMSRDLFFRKELQLRVSRSYGPGRYDARYEEDGVDYPIGYVRWTEGRLIRYFHEEVAAGRVKLEPLITHEVDFSDAPAAYAALDEPGRLAILLRYSSADAEPAPRPERPIAVPASRDPQPSRGRLRVALIGPGLFARSTLLPLLAEQPVDLVAVAGRGGAHALGAARRFGNARVATSDEVLNAPDIDVVVIATRHDSHAALASVALANGKAVLLEKPLAIDDAGLESVTATMSEDSRLVVDFNRRSRPLPAKRSPLSERGRTPFMWRVGECRSAAGRPLAPGPSARGREACRGGMSLRGPLLRASTEPRGIAGGRGFASVGAHPPA